MALTMYDSTNVAAIPAHAQFVAGYVDGNLRTWNAIRTRFLRARHYPIYVDHTTQLTALGPSRCVILDVEQGNPNTTQDVVDWVAECHVLELLPIVYTNLSNWQGLRDAFIGKVPPLWWVAGWTGHPYSIPGAAATQWASPGTGSGGYYDVSELTGSWPGTEGPVSQSGWTIPKPKPRHLIIHAPALSAGIAGVTGNLPHISGVSAGEVWAVLVGGSVLAGIVELILSRFKPDNP